jgi:hypothetical protein
MKVTFTMSDPDPKRHSTRFNFEALEESPTGLSDAELSKALKNASFYVPKPLGASAKRIRVTIEEL